MQIESMGVWHGHGFPKVSGGPAMPYPSMPCELATPETALVLFQGWPTHREICLQQSFTPLYTPHRTLLLRWS
jgi:hypothetical protein